MNKKMVLLWIVALLLLVACGGGEAEPAAPATDNDTSTSSTTETEEESADPTEEPSEEEMAEEEEEMQEEATEESDEAEEANEADEATEEDTSEEAAEEVVEEAASDSPFGDRLMSGVDPETGLAINPEIVNPGDTFIVRGEIISMNLTPTTSPEFLIQSPDGLKFRLRSQDLAETFFEDGDQLQAFQYQLGLLAQATATLAADASPSDIPTSTDLVLVKDE